MQRLLVGSPIRQTPAILSEFLRSLLELTTDGMTVDYLFVDDNDDPASAALLAEFRPPGKVTILPTTAAEVPYAKDEVTHHWLPTHFSRVGDFKDNMIVTARDEDYDALFFVDSDLILHPHTLHYLFAARVDICSEVFWTSWNPAQAELPQVWLQDQYNLFAFRMAEALESSEIQRLTDAFLAQLRVPGVYEVGGLGACTLIRRRALQAGVSFRTLPNLSLVGEDRHFCVRAVALGFKLYADTHVPPLHIYRNEDLARIAAFREAIQRTNATAPPLPRIDDGPAPTDETSKPLPPPVHLHQRFAPNAGLVLSMIVHNEADRFLRRVLSHAATYVDAAVIIDDASTDETVAVCEEVLAGIPHKIVSLPESLFHHESELRRKQWELTLAESPNWVLCLDADELFEDTIRSEISSIVSQTTWEAMAFRLYDFWDEFHYREDQWWKAHEIHRAFLTRVTPKLQLDWPRIDQHSGRFPPSVYKQMRIGMNKTRVKHLGWSTPRERHRKYERYQLLDPKSTHGVRAQYDSILDLRPTLRRWAEEGTFA